MENTTRSTDSPATLVTIVVAAHRAGYRELEREMRSRLEQDHGIRLTISRDRDRQRREVGRAE